MGSFLLAGSAMTLVRGEDISKPGRALVYGLGAAELVAIGQGVHGLMFHRSPGEKLYDEFAAALAGGALPSPRVVAEAETKLLKLAAYYRFDRRLSVGLGLSTVALGTAMTVVNELAPYANEQERVYYRYLLLGSTGLALGLSTYLLFPSAIERIAELWTHDPDIMQLPRLSQSPQRTDQRLTGAALTLTHTF